MVALAVLVSLPSCTKPEKQIIGKWKIVSAKVDGDKDEDAKGEVWTFKDNGKFSGFINLGLVWGVKISSDVDCKWRIDGNELVLSGGDLEFIEDGYSVEVIITMDIEQLDNEALILSGVMKVEGVLVGYVNQIEERHKVSCELEAK